MSDEAVKRRARQLGMVEAESASGDAQSRTLKEIQEEENKSTSSGSSSTTTVTTDSKTGQKTTTTTTTKQHTSGDRPDDGKDADENEKQDDAEEKTEGTKKVSNAAKPKSRSSISISSGDTSDDVGQKLEKAGIVESGSDFNHYLEQHGYDRTIHSGTYSFEKGASYSSIAGKISGK